MNNVVLFNFEFMLIRFPSIFALSISILRIFLPSILYYLYFFLSFFAISLSLFRLFIIQSSTLYLIFIDSKIICTALNTTKTMNSILRLKEYFTWVNMSDCVLCIKTPGKHGWGSFRWSCYWFDYPFGKTSHAFICQTVCSLKSFIADTS